MTGREMTVQEVLADLFEEMLVQNSEELAKIVIERLRDAGFAIVPAPWPGMHTL